MSLDIQHIALIANPDNEHLETVLCGVAKTVNAFGIRIRCGEALFKRVLKARCSENGFDQIFNVYPTEQEAIKQSQLVIALGGDGTILYTANLIKELQIPILGVNAGKMGFMSTFQPEFFEKGFAAFLSGQTEVDQRIVLEAENPEGEHFHALNEIAISQSDITSLIRIKAFYNGDFVTRYWSDGLIISTPTGSTAYNLSLGGPIIYPTTPVLALTPINPHNLTMRPIVLPLGELTLEVEQRQGKVRLNYDGFAKGLYEVGFQIKVKPASFGVFLVKMKEQGYFSTLREKLMWGKDFRD